MNLRTAIATSTTQCTKRFAAMAMLGALALTTCGGDRAPDTFEASAGNRAALAAEAQRYVELQESRAAQAAQARDNRTGPDG